MDKKKHNEQIIDQFTKTASSYSAIASHSDALNKLIEITSPTEDDLVLDVACGSGIVTLAFAKKVKHITGIDITKEMLREAEKSQIITGLKNIDWELGEADALPFADNTFTIVISRFSFHHFIEPKKVLIEMLRVCKPGGTVMVADVAIPKSKTTKYDEMEKLRDPSHVAVMTPHEIEELMIHLDLKQIKKDNYQMEIKLEEQLSASFSENSEKLKLMIINDIGKDCVGINATKKEKDVSLYYPIHIFAGTK